MTSEKLKFTIVITSYNYENYIGAAIESALGQTRAIDQILVIDDGSTDGSREIISGYKDRITAIFQENAGMVGAWNRAYDFVEGDIVIYLDADDLLHSNAAEEIENRWTPQLSKIQYDLEVIDEHGELLGRRFCDFRSEQSAEYTHDLFLRTGTYIWPVTSGNAYARKFLDQLMPLTPPGGCDGVLNTLAPLYGDVATITAPLGQYRLHGKNKSLGGGSNRVRDFSKAIRLRHEEFEVLRQHAEILGVKLSGDNMMDNELTFVSYRMMAKKLHQEYWKSEMDTVARLWRLGVDCAYRENRKIRKKIMHVVWLSVFALTNKSLAQQLVNIRYRRAEIIKKFTR